jgi:hypothetical protein
MDKWQPCPRCNSNKVERIGKLYMFIAGIFITGVCAWITLIFPPMLIGIIIGILLMLISPFARAIMICKDCKNKWR